jgi:hypothetical protein
MVHQWRPPSGACGGIFGGFHDPLELRLVSAFVQHGVTIPVIRATVDAARGQFGIGLYASYLAERCDSKAAARIFDISTRMVDAAVRFEQSFGT